MTAQRQPAPQSTASHQGIEPPVRGRAAWREGFRFRPVLPAALLCFGILALAGWPVDMLVVRDEESLVFSAPAPLGQEYRTRYIHSVQHTPVMDVYRIQQSRIWQWQEWTQSHNAGLPSLPPANGRFISRPPWMVMQGGRESWDVLRYRVGSAFWGRNEFLYPPAFWSPLYIEHEGRRLEFRIIRTPLLLTAVRWTAL